jgi:hypothetical protein
VIAGRQGSEISDVGHAPEPSAHRAGLPGVELVTWLEPAPRWDLVTWLRCALLYFSHLDLQNLLQQLG